MIRVVCKTIRDGSNPSVHLRSVCKTSASLLLEHAGLWILEYRFKSDGRCVSFVQWKGQGTSNPPIQVRVLYETSGYVAKRLCTGLLTRDTQVRLLSYPSVITRKSYPCFEKLPYLIKMIVFCKSKQSQYQIYSVLICIIQVCSLYFEFQIGLFKCIFLGFFNID